jgi:hypothetical protein
MRVPYLGEPKLVSIHNHMLKLCTVVILQGETVLYSYGQRLVITKHSSECLRNGTLEIGRFFCAL